MFTEKIFICLWLWLLFLCFTDVFGLLFWTVTTIAPTLRIKFVLKYLDLSDSPPDPLKDAAHIRKFVLNFLRPDGVLMLRMIANHGGTILCSELVYSLWLRYRETFKLTVEPPDDEELQDGASSTGHASTTTEKPPTGVPMPVLSNRKRDSAGGGPDTADTDPPPRSMTPLPDEESELQPWAKVPPMPLIGNHRPTMLNALAGGVGKGRFIPERPNHSGSSAEPRSPSVARVGGEEYGSAYV